MATKINKLQVRQAKFNSTKMTDLNHWSNQLAIKPTVFEAPTRAIFASKTNSLNLSSGNVLEGIFGMGKTKYIDDLNWSWKMKVKGFRPMTIIENRTSGSTPGKYRGDIKVLVDVDLFAIGESIGPGSSDKSQVVTVTNKVKEGARGYVYTLKTYTEGAEHFINPKYLKPGTKWTRMFTMRGEAAESGSHTENYTNVEYKNSLVKLRKEYKVTDFAAQAVVEIAFQDDEGGVHKSWMDKQEADYYQAMNKEMSTFALYSRLGDQPLLDPDSGYPINPGAGMEQQIGFGGNVERYTTMSAELIEAFFDRIVYSRINPGDLGEVMGLSGHYGMKEYAKALDTWTGSKAIIRESSTFIKGTEGMSNNSLRTGFQFVTYDLPTGGSFKLVHNAMNDDKSIHRDIDPLTGVPLQSQRVTILDVTGGSGDSLAKDNICLVRKNKVYGSTRILGRVGPGGVSTGDRATHSGDYYEVHISDSIGVQITDSTVTGELVKSVNE
jgi:hypothetical protein